MKKLLLTALFGLFAVTGFSQTTLDVHGGMTMNNYTGMNPGPDMRVGFTVGLGVDYTLTDLWSVKTGLNFTQKGAKDKEDGIEGKLKPIYMEIPVMAAATFQIADDVKFVANAGPYFAVGIGGKAEAADDGVSASVKLFKDDGAAKATMNRFDMGIQYGIGLEISEHYLINLYGQNGFINPFKGYTELDGKNMTFGLSVGYKF